jgi:hypothetical protein
VILDEAEALLDLVSDIEGFMLACLVDASTGMVLASRKDQDDIGLPTAAAGAADIANVLTQLSHRERPLGLTALAGGPPLSGPAVTLTVPLTSGWRNRPGCIRVR